MGGSIQDKIKELEIMDSRIGIDKTHIEPSPFIDPKYKAEEHYLRDKLKKEMPKVQAWDLCKKDFGENYEPLEKLPDIEENMPDFENISAIALFLDNCALYKNNLTVAKNVFLSTAISKFLNSYITDTCKFGYFNGFAPSHQKYHESIIKTMQKAQDIWFLIADNPKVFTADDAFLWVESFAKALHLRNQHPRELFDEYYVRNKRTGGAWPIRSYTYSPPKGIYQQERQLLGHMKQYLVKNNMFGFWTEKVLAGPTEVINSCDLATYMDRFESIRGINMHKKLSRHHHKLFVPKATAPKEQNVPNPQTTEKENKPTLLQRLKKFLGLKQTTQTLEEEKNL